MTVAEYFRMNVPLITANKLDSKAETTPRMIPLIYLNSPCVMRKTPITTITPRIISYPNLRLAHQAICFSPVLAAKYDLVEGDLIRVSTPDWDAECMVEINPLLGDAVAIAARSNGLPIWEPQVVQIHRLVTEPKA